MNLIAAWKSVPQRTKLLLAGLLGVLSLGLWYGLLYFPEQGEVQTLEPTPPPPPAPTTALEVPPLPPFEPPERAPKGTPPPPKEPPKPQEEVSQTGKTPLPPPTSQGAEPIPPNPFVPLLVETPQAPPALTPRPAPLPSGPPLGVRIGPPYPLTPPPPLPRARASARPLPGSAGPLPLPKVLRPTLSVSPPALAERKTLPSPAGLVETLLEPEDGETPPRGESQEQPLAKAQPQTKLEAFVQERGLVPVATLLGPIGVAILRGKEGYLVLPLGERIPGSEVVLQGIEPDRVVLALKGEERTETLELPIASGGSP